MLRLAPVIPLLLLSGLLAAQTKEPPARDPGGKEHGGSQGKEAPKDGAKDAKEKVDFQTQVFPILEKNCLECHFAPYKDGSKQFRPKGNVVLESKDGILGSKRGKLVVPRKPDESAIIKVITAPVDSKERMPPARKSEPLSKENAEIIRRWISEGAEFGKWTAKGGKDAGAKDGGKDAGGRKDPPKAEDPGRKEPPKGGRKGGDPEPMSVAPPKPAVLAPARRTARTRPAPRSRRAPR